MRAFNYCSSFSISEARTTFNAELAVFNFYLLLSFLKLEGIEIIMDEDSGSGKQAFEFLLHWIQRLYSHVDII